MALAFTRQVDVAVLEEAIERLIASAGASRIRQAQLQHALQSRIVVEQAKGVLAERLQTTPDEAFEILRRRARSTRRKLHDVAHDVVATTTLPGRVAHARADG